MCVSLRDQLNRMGIDGHTCEKLIKEYHSLTGIDGSVTIGLFIQTVKDSVKR